MRAERIRKDFCFKVMELLYLLLQLKLAGHVAAITLRGIRGTSNIGPWRNREESWGLPTPRGPAAISAFISTCLLCLLSLSAQNLKSASVSLSGTQSHENVTVGFYTEQPLI